jgi:tetratricopeptide (TPR) repeat protein
MSVRPNGQRGPVTREGRKCRGVGAEQAFMGSIEDLDDTTLDDPSPAARKDCCMCGIDVSESKRIKDSSDRYWCESCSKLQVRERHPPGTVVCPDCGTTGANMVEQDGVKVCEPCGQIRETERIGLELRRQQKARDPETKLRRKIRLFLAAALLFAVLTILRYTASPIDFEGHIDDWLNAIAIASALAGVGVCYVIIAIRRRQRLAAHAALIERVENAIIALAERQHESQSVVERTESLRFHAKRAVRRIEAAAGRADAKADKLIELFDLRHDTQPLVVYLSDQRPGARDLVARNRELESIAYLGTDYNTAIAAIDAVLFRIPSDLDALTRRAMILCAWGRFDEAKKTFVRIINLAERKDDLLAEADGYANLGLVHQLLDEIDDAHKYHNKALFMYKKLPGNDDREADCYGNIGFIHFRRGERRDAETVFRKALEINTRLKRIEGMALDYGVLGLLVYSNEEGKLSEAERLLRRAVALNDQIGRFGAVAAAYGNLGLVRAKARDFKKARQMLLQALSIYQRLNRPKMVHKVQTMLTQLSKSAPAK